MAANARRAVRGGVEREQLVSPGSVNGANHRFQDSQTGKRSAGGVLLMAGVSYVVNCPGEVIFC